MENGMYKTRKIRIGGREFELAFTLRAMLMMQKRISGFNFNEVDSAAADLESMVEMLYILADNGARLQGKELDADPEWFQLHIPANNRKFAEIQVAIMGALSDGMTMETEEDEDRGRTIDLVLQQIQKKSEKTDSPGEK